MVSTTSLHMRWHAWRVRMVAWAITLTSPMSERIGDSGSMMPAGWRSWVAACVIATLSAASPAVAQLLDVVQTPGCAPTISSEWSLNRAMMADLRNPALTFPYGDKIYGTFTGTIFETPFDRNPIDVRSSAGPRVAVVSMHGKRGGFIQLGGQWLPAGTATKDLARVLGYRGALFSYNVVCESGARGPRGQPSTGEIWAKGTKVPQLSPLCIVKAPQVGYGVIYRDIGSLCDHVFDLPSGIRLTVKGEHVRTAVYSETIYVDGGVKGENLEPFRRQVLGPVRDKLDLYRVGCGVEQLGGGGAMVTMGVPMIMSGAHNASNGHPIGIVEAGVGTFAATTGTAVLLYGGSNVAVGLKLPGTATGLAATGTGVASTVVPATLAMTTAGVTVCAITEARKTALRLEALDRGRREDMEKAVQRDLHGGRGISIPTLDGRGTIKLKTTNVAESLLQDYRNALRVGDLNRAKIKLRLIEAADQMTIGNGDW